MFLGIESIRHKNSEEIDLTGFKNQCSIRKSNKFNQKNLNRFSSLINFNKFFKDDSVHSFYDNKENYW